MNLRLGEPEALQVALEALEPRMPVAHGGAPAHVDHQVEYLEADLQPEMRETSLSYPFILVTPKVMRIIRAAGVTEFDWIPIRVVEDG